jgi:hypothetical protein
MSDAPTIVQRAAPSDASTTRRRQDIRYIVVHVDQRAPAEALDAFTSPGARRAPHYYLAADGTITQLVGEQRAARYTGIALLGRRRRNLDRISVTIVVEGSEGRRATAQAAALHWLVGQIRERHGLLADAALLRWRSPEAGAVYGALEPFDLPEVVRRQAVLSIDEQERRRQAVLGIEDDPAAAQRLWAFLQAEACRQRGDGYKNGSAFHLHAAKNHLGAALGPSSPRSAWISVAGRQYNYQHFALDTVYNEGENWAAVQSVGAVLQGSMPAPGSAEYTLLQSAYAAGIGASKTPPSGNTAFNPSWASAQMAIEQRLGPALSGAYRISVEGGSYAIQVFAADTLYTPIANPESATVWSDVRRLSDTPAGALREQLWAEAYKPSGAAYNASSPLQQAAAEAKLGAPLSGAYQASFEGATVDVQVFALDTLYQVPGGPIRRQSALPLPPEVAAWSPKPAAPQPAVQVSAAQISAASLEQPAGDRASPAWPAVLGGLTPLVSTSDRQRIFGAFQYAAAPQPGNAEHINILGTWQQENIVPVQVPQIGALRARGVRAAPASGTILWHRLAIGQLLRLWAAWEQAGLLDRILSWDGSFNPRFIRGSNSVLSNHAFGTAFDINASLNPLGRTPLLCGQHGCVRELVAIANQFGFFWGGHFSSPRMDGMHFEVARVM